MSNEKVTMKSNKKNKKQEIEPAFIEMLTKTHIILLTKPSSKFPKAKFVCKICPYHMDDVDRAIKHSNDNLHKRNLNKLCTKNLLTYLPNPTKIQIEVINECLERTLKEEHFISKEESERRTNLCASMNELAATINPGNKLLICGSLVTGLSLATISDVNLFLMTESSNSKNTGYLSELEKLSKVFKSRLGLKTEIKLEKTNCGLFCKDKSGVTYHISASSEVQHLTSELVRLYLQIDSRAANLAKIFRYFGHKAFIDQVKDGLFPSQVFAILVIYYLQHLPVPILPNLHKLANIGKELPDESVSRHQPSDPESKYVNDLEWVRNLWTPPTNPTSLAELWIGLLKFYVVDFNSSTYMVSIRCTEPVLKVDRHMINKRLAIEDPFDVKRNLLFSWNSPDVIDFLNDQLQGCYSYFAVPQLATGPLFNKVGFMEISMANLKPNANVTPIFTKDSFGETLDMLENEFKRLYTEQKAFYDVTRWPVELFVKPCLGKILIAVLNSPADIKNLMCILELKVKSCMAFHIENYVKFKEYALRLARNVLQEFSDHFERTSSWSQTDLENKIAFELIKKSAQKFINESLNINDKEDDDDYDELPECDFTELDEEPPADREVVVDIDSIENNEDVINNDKEERQHIVIQDTETWKMPIVFKQIYVPIKGVAISSDNPDEYNENRINNLEKQDLVYDFNKISIHNKKLVITCTLCNTKGHRKENCMFAIPRYEELQDVLQSVQPAWLAKLKSVLNEKHKAIIPAGDRPKQNEKIFEKIAEIIKNMFPSAQPQMFGSTINGFITKSSDLDICLEFYEDEKRQALLNKELTNRLKLIGREIRKMNTISRVDYILRAKVPIVKFYMKNNIQGDISINNSLGIQNTKMLKLYAEIGNGVKFLGNLIKYMTKTCEIGDASQGTLSSYAYMLMLIHFLQKRKVLPVLQELYEGERPTIFIDGWDAWYQSDLPTIYKLWNKKNCNTQVEYLWLDFFYYFAVEFDIDKEVVSIRQSEPLYKIDKNWQSSYMAVEDPFNLSHNLCGSLCLENCRYILECFGHVLKLHSNSDNLSRPEGTHYMLMEPVALRPTVLNGRSCFTCNKPGHIARDCTDKGNKRTPTKSSGTSHPGLPEVPAPLQYKKSNLSNRVYLQSDFCDSVETENMAPYNIPLTAFTADISQYSVVPVGLRFGDTTVIIPTVVGKNNIVERKLNTVLKNGLHNVCIFPTESGRVAPIEHTPTKQPPPHEEYVNSGFSRRQSAKMSPAPPPNSNYRMVIPQQFHRNQVVQHMQQQQQQQQQQRIYYDMPIRLRSNGSNNVPHYPFVDYNNPSAAYHTGFVQEHLRQQPQQWNYHGPDGGRHQLQPAMNNSNTPRGNRK